METQVQHITFHLLRLTGWKRLCHIWAFAHTQFYGSAVLKWIIYGGRMKACLSRPEQHYNSSTVGRTAIKPEKWIFQRASERQRKWYSVVSELEGTQRALMDSFSPECTFCCILIEPVVTSKTGCWLRKRDSSTPKKGNSVIIYSPSCRWKVGKVSVVQTLQTVCACKHGSHLWSSKL